jgi:hypothetical protein
MVESAEELPIGQVRVTAIRGEVLRSLALPFDQKLIPLDSGLHVLLGNAGQNYAEIQLVVSPPGLECRSEGPFTLVGSAGAIEEAVH